MTASAFAAERDEIARSAERSFEACQGLPPRETAARLAEDGLMAILAPDPIGLDLPVSIAGSVVEFAVRRLLPFPLLETVAAVRALAGPVPDVAAALAAGEALIAVAPASTIRADEQSGKPILRGTAGHVLAAHDADWLLTPVALAGREGLALIDLRQPGMGVSHLSDMDLDRPRSTIRLPEEGCVAHAVVAAGPEADDYRALMLTLRAADLLGAAGRALELAVAHVSNRRQFGKPLVGFQALRHDLARARMTLEGGVRLLEAALGGTGTNERIRAAEIAYAFVASKCPGIAELALHLHGGMGFTWDVDAHRYLRRIRAAVGTQSAARVFDGVLERAIAG